MLASGEYFFVITLHYGTGADRSVTCTTGLVFVEDGLGRNEIFNGLYQKEWRGYKDQHPDSPQPAVIFFSLEPN